MVSTRPDPRKVGAVTDTAKGSSPVPSLTHAVAPVARRSTSSHSSNSENNARCTGPAPQRKKKRKASWYPSWDPRVLLRGLPPGTHAFFFVVSILGPTCTTKAVTLWPVSTDLPLGKGTPSLQGAFEPPDQVRGDGLLLAALGGFLARSLGLSTVSSADDSTSANRPASAAPRHETIQRLRPSRGQAVHTHESVAMTLSRKAALDPWAPATVHI